MYKSTFAQNQLSKHSILSHKHPPPFPPFLPISMSISPQISSPTRIPNSTTSTPPLRASSPIPSSVNDRDLALAQQVQWKVAHSIHLTCAHLSPALGPCVRGLCSWLPRRGCEDEVDFWGESGTCESRRLAGRVCPSFELWCWVKHLDCRRGLPVLSGSWRYWFRSGAVVCLA